MRNRFISPTSWVLLWWILIEAGAGLLAYFVAHGWLLVIVLRHLKEAEFFKYFDPTTIWKYSIEYLPSTRGSICLASWGGTAFVCALVVFMVNDFSFKIKRPLPALTGDFQRYGITGVDPDDPNTRDYLDAEESLEGDKDLAAKVNYYDLSGIDHPDLPLPPVTAECIVIGYVPRADGGIDQLLLGVRDDNGDIHYVATVPIPKRPDVDKNMLALRGQLKAVAGQPSYLPAGVRAIAVNPSVTCVVNYAEQDAKKELKEPMLQGFFVPK
jgi:hypothetical protein